MNDRSENPMNVYPQINFMKYVGQIMRKHRLLIVSCGLILGSVLLGFSFIQNYSSSTIFRFQVSETRGSSLTSSIQLEGILGKTESIRDKSFNYLHSTPFYFELGKKLSEHKEGDEIISIFSKSRGNLLLKVKHLFYNTMSYSVKSSEPVKVTEALQKILTFKKLNDNSLVMLVRTGRPALSLKLGRILAPMVREIVLSSETHDLIVASEHLKELLNESNANLLRINEELLQHKEHQQKFNGSDNSPSALMETEKEIRMARIEVQRFDLLIKKLNAEIKNNQTYSIDQNQYKYTDQAALERLEELKQKRDNARASLQSVTRSYEKLKKDFSDVPEIERISAGLKWDLELEQSINKDLIVKNREIEGLQKLADNSIRLIGDTSLVPSRFRFSKPMIFFIGFLIGTFLSSLIVFYFYDFFKVVKGKYDLKQFRNVPLLSIPRVRRSLRGKDLWLELPHNHLVMESFRNLMEKALEEKVVTFLSSRKKEGASFIIANLAENLNRFGKRVLVVDTNFKNPTLSKTLVPRDGLKVITAQQFSHDKYSFLDRVLLIREIRTHSKDCDIVLIDTMSLSENNDGLVAASISNSTMLLSSYLETYHHKFHEVLVKMDAAKIENFSFLLNKLNPNDEFMKGQALALDNVDTRSVHLRKIG